MDIAHIPERYRARVLSSIVRNGRAGIHIRFGKARGGVLPISISRCQNCKLCLSAGELEKQVREEFSGLPYELRFVTAG